MEFVVTSTWLDEVDEVLMEYPFLKDFKHRIIVDSWTIKNRGDEIFTRERLLVDISSLDELLKIEELSKREIVIGDAVLSGEYKDKFKEIEIYDGYRE